MLTLPVVSGKKYITRDNNVVVVWPRPAPGIMACASKWHAASYTCVYTGTGRGNNSVIDTPNDLVADYVEPDQRPQWWIIYSPQGYSAPGVLHYQWEKAWKEAERLAKAHPGKDFYVMEPAAHYKSTAVTTVKVEGTIY